MRNPPLHPAWLELNKQQMADYTPAQLRAVFALAEGLNVVATELGRSLRKKLKAAPRRRGGTLRPGVETPLWNALVEGGRPFLHRRGEKALLARELGLDRSRVSQFFVTRRAMPDAERALELLVWLAQRRKKE